MARKSIRKIQKLTSTIARPYARRLEGSSFEGTGKGTWFRTSKRTGLRKLVADRVRAERRAGYIKRGKKDY